MEKINTEKTEIDPRRKDSQGLDFWAQSLLDAHLITQKQFDEFVSKNNNKEKSMSEFGLPQLRHYGFFESVNDIREKLQSLVGERFIIRCTSKDSGEIKRLIDTDLNGVCDFAEHLPGGFEQWKVEVKEFTETIVSGTIMVSSTGAMNIETWHGPHYLSTTNEPKYTASFDPEKFDLHINWNAPKDAEDLEIMQNYALKALRHWFPYIAPKPNNQIYIEYGIKKDGQVYFIEANDSSLLTDPLV